MVAHAFDARQSNVVQYGNLTGPLDTCGQSVGVLQPVAIHPHCVGRSPDAGPQGKEYIEDGSAYCLDARGVPQAVALIGGIDYENNGHTADEPTGPLLKGSPTGGGRPLPAVAIRTANTSANGHGVALDVAHTLDQAQGQAVAFEPGSIARHAGPAGESHLAPTLRKEMGDNQPAVRVGMSVRRLTPRECERLQGFPDDYTLITYLKKPACDLLQGFPDDYTPITYRGKPAADGPRYKALGNSMAVPVMRWIGQRIQEVDRVER